MLKPWPLFTLAILLITVIWLNPPLITIAGKLAVVLIGLAVGVFFGSYLAASRQRSNWTLHTHTKHIARLLLERIK